MHELTTAYVMWKGSVDDEVYWLSICKYMWRSRDEYMQTPNHIIEKVDIMLQSEAQYQKILSKKAK